MRGLLPLSLERDGASSVLDTGQQGVGYLLPESKGHQQLKDTGSDLYCNGPSPRPDVAIQRSHDVKPMVLDPGKDLVSGVGQLHVRHVEVMDKVRCLRNFMGGMTRFWNEHLNLELYRCSITKMVNHSICVVAVEPRLACLKSISKLQRGVDIVLHTWVGLASSLRSAAEW